MTTKKVTLEALDARFTKLEHVITTGFERTDRNFAAIAEDIADIKRDMATRDQIVALHTQVNSIERELRDIKRRLTHVEDNTMGYRKEIDDALERIRKIEKHLGMEKKIAA